MKKKEEVITIFLPLNKKAFILIDKGFFTKYGNYVVAMCME